MRVLVAEDHKKTASFIRKALQAEGCVVDVLYDGADALAASLHTPFDVIVLDIMLPGRDGLSVLRKVRERGIRTPVLLLTALSEVDQKVEGLNAGANDYLSKPFALEELVARVHALGRRASKTWSALARVGDLTVNTITREVRRGGRSIDLTPREFQMLDCLMRAQGKIISRTGLIEKVWNYNFDPGTNLVDVYIMRLRQKIDEGFERKLLHTVRGLGYALKEPQ